MVMEVMWKSSCWLCFVEVVIVDADEMIPFSGWWKRVLIPLEPPLCRGHRVLCLQHQRLWHDAKYCDGIP